MIYIINRTAPHIHPPQLFCLVLSREWGNELWRLISIMVGRWEVGEEVGGGGGRVGGGG